LYFCNSFVSEQSQNFSLLFDKLTIRETIYSSGSTNELPLFESTSENNVHPPFLQKHVSEFLPEVKSSPDLPPLRRNFSNNFPNNPLSVSSEPLPDLNESTVTSWSTDAACLWLYKMNLVECVPFMESHGISGAQMLELDDHRLKEMGIVKLGVRKRFLKAMTILKNINDDSVNQEETRTSSESVSSGSSEGEGIIPRSFDEANKWGVEEISQWVSTMEGMGEIVEYFTLLGLNGKVILEEDIGSLLLKVNKIGLRKKLLKVQQILREEYERAK